MEGILSTHTWPFPRHSQHLSHEDDL